MNTKNAAQPADPGHRTLDVEQRIEVRAPIRDVFEGLLHRMSGGSTRPDNEPMPMVLEARPGGRWYRDLGNDTGHLWGIVQVIKPPRILEIYGPMFMSYPAVNHIEVRLEEAAGVTGLTLRHRSLGFLSDDHVSGLTAGWASLLEGVKADREI